MADGFKIVKINIDKCLKFGCEFCENNQQDENHKYRICQNLGYKTRAEYEGIISQIISDFTSSEYGIDLAKAVVDKLFGEGE